MIGEISTCSGVADDPKLLWIFSNFCPLNLVLVRNHQAEIIIVKRLNQRRKNVTRVRVERRPYDLGRRENDAFTHLATLPTKVEIMNKMPAYSCTINICVFEKQSRAYFLARTGVRTKSNSPNQVVIERACFSCPYFLSW